MYLGIILVIKISKVYNEVVVDEIYVQLGDYYKGFINKRTITHTPIIIYVHQYPLLANTIYDIDYSKYLIPYIKEHLSIE